MLDPQTLRRRVHLFRALTILAIVLVALSIPLAILKGGLPPDIAQYVTLGEVSLTHRVAIALAGALPAAAAIWTLTRVLAFLDLYGRGLSLTIQSAATMRAIGCGLFAIVAAQIIARPLQSLVASAFNPAGERSLVISLQGGDLGLVLAAGLVILIAQAIAEAASNRDELDAIV